MIHIRWMIRRDMPEVLQIERESFEYTWTEDDFLNCLRQHNCIGMVAERADRIVGFTIYELCENCLRVLNFAVAPLHRRGGVGARMVARLVDSLWRHQRGKIELAVRESNLSAQLFFRVCGLKATQVLRNYYKDSGEDAFRMEYLAVVEIRDDACLD